MHLPGSTGAGPRRQEPPGRRRGRSASRSPRSSRSGHLRTLLPASRPLPGSRRLPLYGYAAVVEHHDELRVAALNTDGFGWWEPARYAGAGLPEAIDARARGAARRTASSTTWRSARPTFVATRRRTPSSAGTRERSPPRRPATRIASAASRCRPTARRRRRSRACVSRRRRRSSRGWRRSTSAAGTPPSSRSVRDARVSRSRATTCSPTRSRLIRQRASVGHDPRQHQRQPARTSCSASSTPAATACASAPSRSAIPSSAPITGPVGYSIEDVIECGRVMSRAGGQVCVNLLTFPGVTDSSAELDRTVRSRHRDGRPSDPVALAELRPRLARRRARGSRPAPRRRHRPRGGVPPSRRSAPRGRARQFHAAGRRWRWIELRVPVVS